MQAVWNELFPESTAIVPEAGEEQRVAWAEVPARGAVYLLACEAEGEAGEGDGGEPRPVLLATVGDLRSALKRKLGELPPEGRTRRVPYGQLCSRVFWRRVDSSFGANWWYAKAARTLYPATFTTLIPWRSSWWIAVEREGPFPRLRRTTDLGDGGMRFAGPVRDKSSAGKLIETLEDLFDLCRYHAELVQAPRGKPCAYKEMGKCPAPCDGSVPIAWYRGQMDQAWAFLTGDGRAAWKSQTEAAMKAAAARLEFETAGKIKQRLARAAAIEGEAFVQVRPLEAFSFVAIQPGKGKPWVEPWIIHGGRVECLAQVPKKELAAGMERVRARYEEIARDPIEAPIDEGGMEQIALTAHHLFRGEDDHGIYVHGPEIARRGAAALVGAAEKLWARKAAPKPMVEQSSVQPTVAPAAATPGCDSTVSQLTEAPAPAPPAGQEAAP